MARLLIVDDDADARDALGRFLTESGHTVMCVPNGREALMNIIMHPPDLVVLDLYMPEMDGLGLLQVIRSYLRLQSLAVVIWTAVPDSPMLSRMRELRVTSILIKPRAQLSEILETIEKELSKPRE